MKKIILLIIYLCICLMFLPHALADLDEGLVGYWPFNGNANDESGNGYNGTVIGASLCDDRMGNSESAYCFDGVDDYINIGQQPDFPSWDTYAVSLWFLHDGGGDTSNSYGQKIIDKTVWYHDFYLNVYTNVSAPEHLGKLAYYTYEVNGAGITDSSYDYRDNLWHHAVINKSGSYGELWVDGNLIGTSNNIKTVYSWGELLIGYSLSGDHYQRRYWSGKIDDIRIYNRALSENEILELYGESNFSDFSLKHALINFKKLSDSDNYYINGCFTLGETSDGIDPIEEVVKLKVGTSNLEIPAGSFLKIGKRKYKFIGKIDDVRVHMNIKTFKSNGFGFMARIRGIDLTDTPNPVPIGLYIGDDMGQTDIWLSGILTLK